MIVRMLTPDDASQYQALRLRSLLESPTAFLSSYEDECDHSPETIQGRLKSTPDKATFGVFVDRELVALAGASRERYRKQFHRAIVWAVYVAPECRRRGIARKLMEQVLAFARAIPGITRIHLGVNASNTAAVALYKALGFESYASEPAFMVVDGVPQDELLMVYRCDADGNVLNRT